MMITIDEQIKEINRELNMRKGCYPRWIEQGKIEPTLAEKRIALMNAILQTLIEVEREKSPQQNLFSMEVK